MFTAAELAEHQADARASMTLTVRGYSPGTAGAIQPGDLARTRPFEDQGASAAKVQSPGRQPQGRTAEVGGAERTIIEGGLHLPVDAYLDPDGRLLIEPGWEFEVEDLTPGLDDPALKGQRYYVVEVPKKSRLTARRLDVVEV